MLSYLNLSVLCLSQSSASTQGCARGPSRGFIFVHFARNVLSLSDSSICCSANLDFPHTARPNMGFTYTVRVWIGT